SSLSARPLEPQLVTGDPRGIADVQAAVSDDGVVPGLALDCLEPAEFAMLVRVRLDEHHLALVRDDDEQRLIPEQQHLPAAVASILPVPLAGLQVDTGQDPAVEAVNRAPVHDKVIERGLQEA